MQRFRMTGWLLALLLLAEMSTLSLLGQQRGGNRGGGGFGGGGFGGGGGGGSTSASGRQYYNNGMIGDAIITADPETRRLIVITDDETSQYISQVITNLDRPKPQVLIKVVFMEVTHSKGSDIGIEGSLSKKIGGSTIGSVSNLFGLTPGVGGSLAAPAGGGLYQVLGNDFTATLRAIASAGKTEVLSRPSILTRNSQPATITVGKTLPFTTNVRFDNNGNQINTVSYQDVGIILRVTPFITSDGLVEMIVAPEISDIIQLDTPIKLTDNTDALVISKTSADTVVLTPDGQTVVIGGLMQTTKGSVDSKIPILGDIPLLGLAFRREQKKAEKKELLIFLTPHIVKEPSNLLAVSNVEKSQATLSGKAFTEEDLNKFVDGLPVKQMEEAEKAEKESKKAKRAKDRR
ncbi:MAG: type II secretion system protein GspD [Verrucomicrobiales bacterium]|nr:type II secretion system protein GspD [Verrucomicrobiales bacterium]